ncbi:cytochrome P450 [Hymenopellis radicata]|nr:cytochrome P450 [Hymenopellis radicata]
MLRTVCVLSLSLFCFVRSARGSTLKISPLQDLGLPYLQMSFLPLELGLIILSAWILRRLATTRTRNVLPPGPKGYPIIGNLLDIPSAAEWIMTMQMWGERWGNLVSLSVFGTTIVFINSYSMAMDILEKKSSIYSDRPFVPMAMDLMEMKDSIGLIPARDKRFKAGRRMFQQELGRGSISNFYPQEERAAQLFVKNVLSRPDELKAHCLRHAGGIILKVAYGYELEAREGIDPMVQIVNTAMENFNKATAPGGFLVNHMHILMKVPDWFPGAGFKRQGRAWAKDYWRMVDVPFNYVKAQLAAGTAEESFTARWLKQNISYEDELNLKHTSSSMFGAGVDTSAVTFYAFYLAMCNYPDIQRKAKDEIDSVVGRDRLPSFQDRAHMPYVEALCKELTRYHVAVPSGMPHCTSQDDVHNGMFIPAGAIVMASLWNMAHDPKVYKEPMQFNPARFLGDNPEQDPETTFSDLAEAGRLLADASIYITVTTSLAVFDIKTLPGSTPMLEPLPGIVSDIKPFKCAVTPRIDADRLLASIDE